MTLIWADNSLVKNYCNKFIRQNLWKVKKIGYEADDLSQEFYIIYHECKNKYKNLNDAQFFARFKTAIKRRMGRLALSSMKEQLVELKLLQQNELEEVYNEAELKLKLDFAPQLIKDFLFFAVNDKDVNRINLSSSNKRMNKILGIGRNTKIDEIVKRYILE